MIKVVSTLVAAAFLATSSLVMAQAPTQPVAPVQMAPQAQSGSADEGKTMRKDGKRKGGKKARKARKAKTQS